MKVVNTQPFGIVYSVVEHPHLGYLIEPFVVQVNSLGKYTLLSQKMFSSNFDYFEKGLDDIDRRIIKILEELDQEKIVKKYHRGKPIRPAEFFRKHFNEELFKKFIRPFIERKLLEALEFLPAKELFLMGTGGNPAAVKIRIAEEKASVLFHFRPQEEGFNYFPTIKCGNARIEIKGRGGVLLVNQPAWLLSGNVLYFFDRHVDGNKLKPFLKKNHIHIPAGAVGTYFRKFVIPLIERFDVYAQGFEIRSENFPARPVLLVDSSWKDEIRLNLYFDYAGHRFPYHSNARVSVFLEENDKKYIFHRVRRDRHYEEEICRFLEEKGLKIVSGSSFTLPRTSGDGVSAWLSDHLTALGEKGFMILRGGDKKCFMGKRSLDLKVEESGDWFDVHARVFFGDFEIPFIQLRKNIQEERREFVLPNGEIAFIPEEWFVKISALTEHSPDTANIRIRRHHWTLLQLFDTKDFSGKMPGLSQESIPEAPVPQFLADLRPYQTEGFRWFYTLKRNGFGGCLADDMGLGKTIQTLALLSTEKELAPEALPQADKAKSIIAPPFQQSLFEAARAAESRMPFVRKKFISLVVVPTSLIYNWSAEAARFAPNLRTYVHSGAGRIREAEALLEFELIISTYGVLRIDIDLFEKIHFDYIILDESQSIKNPGALISKTVSQLKGANRLALTGTPIENSVTDLWSQMNFVNPGLLGSYTFFQKKFAIPIEKENNEARREQLHTLISPFILRRTKKQVAADLPDKYEHIQFCEMTEEQRKIYDETKSVFRNAILQSVSLNGIRKSKLQILKGLILLRQIANHPRLSDPEYTGESGKFTEIVSLLETAISEGHKILLFSQFVKHLALFREYFDARGTSYCYLDGSTTGKERIQQVGRFNSDPSVKLFIISLKAGGTGLNLTSADYVFLADPWWNPAVERQATDRAHRIGQTQKVFSYKFITKDSVEEKILALQHRKLELAGDIIEADEQVLGNIGLDDLEDILT